MRYYGHSATGFTATDTKKAQKDAKRCTGIPRSGCTLTSNLITYGTYGEPSVRSRVEQIKDFIRLWDSLDKYELPKFTEQFQLLTDQLTELEPQQRAKARKGPISGIILTLFDIGWYPFSPTTWIPTQHVDWDNTDLIPT